MVTGGRALVDELALERTRLANERTLLAYIRTGLAIVAGGFGVAEFMRGPSADVIGAVLMALGGLTLIIGVWRFGLVRKRLSG